LGSAIAEAFRTCAATNDLICNKNPPEDPETTEEPPDPPWKTSRDPHVWNQGVTSLAHVGHAQSVKNRHSRCWIGKNPGDHRGEVRLGKISQSKQIWLQRKKKKKQRKNISKTPPETHQKIAHQPKSREVFYQGTSTTIGSNPREQKLHNSIRLEGTKSPMNLTREKQKTIPPSPPNTSH
jgi:hypothetical protein